MEYVGEEKKIQELFHELRLETERVTPRFATVWSRAQSAPVRPLRAFNLSFALATALLVCALGGLALWSRSWQSSLPPKVASSNPPAIPGIGPVPVVPTPSNVETSEPRSTRVKKPAPIKLAVRSQTEMAALKTEIKEATAISNWESPTSSLLRSPSEQVLTTVPQFSDAVKDMKSFLPTDKPKEK